MINVGDTVTYKRNMGTVTSQGKVVHISATGRACTIVDANDNETLIFLTKWLTKVGE
jgi:hypothetical protein